MSLSTTKKIAGGIAGAALIAGLVLVPTTGADFSASDTGRVDINTATLSIGLTDNKESAGTFDLDFANLAPGQSQVQTFYVTNTGSIAADASIGAPISGVSFAPNNGQNANLLRIGVDGIVAPAPAANISTIVLGTVEPGQTRAFNLRVELDQSAGNEWQGTKVGAIATVTLNQK